MTPTQHERIEALFEQALALSPDERSAFLNQQDDDPRILSEVRQMLAADAAETDWLEQAALGTQFSIEGALTPGRATIPEQIGRYRVLGVLGEGGMGTVYLAEQEHPRRQVAVKTLRPGLVSARLLRRFGTEAEILGSLQHPGIAQVFEAGLVDLPHGRQPYFAMEYIQGRPLCRYAADEALDVRSRVELVARICDAVHHAHQKGVIHRDLKPDNVLIAEPDTGSGTGRQAGFVGLGQPKVLDFGIARQTDTDLQRTTLHTDADQLLGTLPYMSPEQMRGTPGELDTRVDVYALGVMLYELLAGEVPLHVRGVPLAEAARIIEEQEPPALGRYGPGLRGDLETIARKALAKEVGHRYDSAAALAADLRRYLDSEPIIAHPPSTWYQLRKFAVRNTGLVSGAAVGVFLLLIGVALAAWWALESNRSARRAESHAQLAAQREQRALRQEHLATLLAADSALQLDQPGRARAILDRAPATQRGFGWRLLNSLATPDLREVDLSAWQTPQQDASRSDGLHIGFQSDGTPLLYVSAKAGCGRSIWSGRGSVTHGMSGTSISLRSQRISRWCWCCRLATSDSLLIPSTAVACCGSTRGPRIA